MAEPVTFVDSSEVREGKLEELKGAMKDLVAFVETNEPRPFSYAVYFNEDETRMTVVQTHPDSASMENHMKVGATAFPGLAEFVKLKTMDVYGEPSEVVLSQLRAKIELLGEAEIRIHGSHAGFARYETR